MDDDTRDRLNDRIKVCWLQAEGLAESLHENINVLPRDFYESPRIDSVTIDNRLTALETKAFGLMAAIREIRTLRRYA